LAMGVGAGKPAEVRAITLAHAGDEERIVPVPVEIGVAGAIGLILCCQIVAANVVVTEQ
jgi:hypothetical protein